MSRMDIAFNSAPEDSFPGFGELVEMWATTLEQAGINGRSLGIFTENMVPIEKRALETIQEQLPEVKYPKYYVDALVFGALLTAQDIKRQAALAEPEDVYV